MKHLILLSHPNPKSFGNGIKKAVLETLHERGDESRVRDLYEIGFDPVLKSSDFVGIRSGKVPADILAEQEHVRWCDVMTFIYPTWWTGLPAILKGYIDRVFSYGFAYTSGNSGTVKLLTGKKAVIITTGGMAEKYYEQIGMLEAMKKTTDTGIFDFCGIEVLHHRYFGQVPSSGDETRHEMLDEVRGIIRSI